MPKVSVIMGAYNCEDTVHRSIDSILNQTFEDWEFIICDDCSTDNTLLILNKYQEQYPNRFIILKNAVNSKLAYSLNACLAVAKGEYIARMDADDESLPERFERQVDFLDQHPEYAVAATGVIPMDGITVGYPRFSKEIPVSRDLINGPVFPHATIMMRKNAYDAINGYFVSKRTERGQDYDMWFRFFESGFRGYNIQEPLYIVLEDKLAMKRKTFRARLSEAKTMYLGFRRLHFPLYCYIFTLKPLVAAVIPKKVLEKIHKQQAKRKAESKRITEGKIAHE